MERNLAETMSRIYLSIQARKADPYWLPRSLGHLTGSVPLRHCSGTFYRYVPLFAYPVGVNDIPFTPQELSDMCRAIGLEWQPGQPGLTADEVIAAFALAAEVDAVFTSGFADLEDEHSPDD